MDPLGGIGDSSLCGPVPEADAEGLALLRAKQDEYLAKDEALPVVPMLPDAVLVPMQMARDVAIYAHSPFKKIGDWVKHVLETFPDRNIVFKTHPKMAGAKLDLQGRKDVQVVTSGSFTQLARQASFTYGQTSTTLYEAALVGANVQVVGNCQLRHHERDVESLLIQMLRQQFKRTEKDLMPYIEEAHAYHHANTSRH